MFCPGIELSKCTFDDHLAKLFQREWLCLAKILLCNSEEELMLLIKVELIKDNKLELVVATEAIMLKHPESLRLALGYLRVILKAV